LGQQLGDNKAIALAYSDLSNLFWKQSRFEKGVEYGLISLRIFEQRGINDLDYDFTLYVVGNNYLEFKEYGEALTYFRHALAIGERYGFYNNISDVYISMVDLMAKLNRLDEAENAGQNALKYARLLDNNFMTMRSLLAIGKLQNLQGRYESAIGTLQNCIEVATDHFGDEYFLSQAFETLGKADAGNHSYQEAYQAMARYDQLKNQIFTAEADQRISLLQTELDLDQKEHTIQLQTGKIQRQRTTQILTVSLIGCWSFICC
jgi:tetratricopeptide (TPR) repeat protein